MLLVAESPLALPESVNTSVSDQKRFFSLNVFFQESSCHGIFDFLFEISALESFYLSTLLECCLCVLAEFGVGRIILLLFVSLYFQKIQKTITYHHALHFAFCIVLALDLDLLWSNSQDFIQGNLHSAFEEELCISCSSIPCFHGDNAFSLIVRCAFYFLLCHNFISCTSIYP